MKTTQVRVKLSEDNSAAIRRLADHTGLQQIAVATTIMHAAIEAIRSTKALPFPIRFNVSPAIPEPPVAAASHEHTLCEDKPKPQTRLAAIIAQLGDRLKEVSSLLNPSPSLASTSGKTILELINEMLVSKAGAGVRDRYLIQLRHALNLFGEGRFSRPVTSITASEIEEWLFARDWAPATRRSYVTDIRTLFNFGVRRGYLEKSPANGVERPRLDDKPPPIHTPEEAEKMLHTAQAQDVDVMRLLAIQYFAGIRPSEAALLDEAAILPGGFIEVQGARSKSRQRRLVTVLPGLNAFLGAGGRLPVVNLVRRFRRVRDASGVKWGHDVTRHSFASYHLAEFQSADKTAHQMGHRSTQMLFAHYREVVRPEAAARFWAIRPK